MDEREFCDRVLDVAIRKGANYADVRIVPYSATEDISVKNGVVENLEYSEGAGFGIRVLLDGVWGFASSANFSDKEIPRVVDLALRIAKASALTRKKPVKLSSALIWKNAQYKSTYSIDPFKVSLEEKVDLLVKADQSMRKESKKVKVTECDLSFNRMIKYFSSTEGSFIRQEIVISGGGISARAVEGDEVQTRSYPNSFRGNFATQGYEFIEKMNLLDHATRIASEAEQLLTAPDCPDMETNVILMPSQLCLQIHESIGHAVELDRILGSEITYAGGSFLTPLLSEIGKFRYGSPLVNIVADATLDGGLGSFGFDDEGVEGRRFPLISEGIWKDLLTSRESVAEANELLGKDYFQSSNGTMRSSFSNRIPLIRMTNIVMEPGTTNFDDLIASTDDGLILDTNYTWSIDDLRKNFSFAVEVAMPIKKGKIGPPYRNTLYTGITPIFLE